MITFNPREEPISFQWVLPCFISSTLSTLYGPYCGIIYLLLEFYQNIRCLRQSGANILMSMSPQKHYLSLSGPEICFMIK